MYTHIIKPIQKELEMKTKFATLFVLFIVAVIVSACGSKSPSDAPTSVLTQEQAIEIAMNALANGYNNSDSVAYLRDMDDSMKAAVTPDGFVEFIQPYKAKYGDFVSVDSAELSHAKTSGYVRWTYTCSFEKGTLYFALVFPQNGNKAAGATISDAKP
jgi:predicted small lipoprotein YifL